MKKLTEADYELLKSRGVEELTTVRLSPDAGEVLVSSAMTDEEKKERELIGKILHTSWGYDMTMNDFCKVISVSPTGKTVLCRMVNTKTNGGEWGFGGTGRAEASDEMVGPEFRLKVSKWSDESWNFHGSYPFCGAKDIPLKAKKSEYSNRKGYFSISAPGESYYENHMD